MDKHLFHKWFWYKEKVKSLCGHKNENNTRYQNASLRIFKPADTFTKVGGGGIFQQI